MESSKEALSLLLPYLIPITIALALAMVLVAVIRRVNRRIIARRPQQEREIRLVSGIIRNLALVIIFLTLLEAVNVPLGNLWTAVSTVIALVAIGFFAVWSVLSHMTASVVLFFQRPFRPGDNLQLADDNYTGEVLKTGLFYTVVRDSDGGLSQIPNNLLFQRRFRVTKPVTPDSLD
jgi:small-conductance mechanosensitive channel